MASHLDREGSGFGDERTTRGRRESDLIAYPLQYVAFVCVVAHRCFVLRQPASLWGDMALLLALSAAEMVRFTLAHHGVSKETIRPLAAGAFGALVVAVGLRIARFTWPQACAGALAAWLPLQITLVLFLGWRKLRRDEAWRLILAEAACHSQRIVLLGIAVLGLLRYLFAEETVAAAAPLAFMYAWVFPGFLVSLMHGKSAGSTIRTGVGRRRLVTWPLVLLIVFTGAVLIKGADWRFVAVGVVSVAIGGWAAWSIDRNAAESLKEHLRRQDGLDQDRGGQAGGIGSMA